jgi:hypothetical protein
MALENQALLNCSSRSRIMRVVERARVICSPVIAVVAMHAPTPPSKVKKEPGAYEVAT